MDTNFKKQQNKKDQANQVASSLVSIDLTVDACMETFWNESKRPAPSLVRLKSKATMHHSQAAQAHLQEHAIRLSLQHSLGNKQQLTTHTSDIKAFSTSPVDVKIGQPTDQFYGTVWEGLPSLPKGANVFNSSARSQPEYFKVAKQHQDVIDKIAKVGIDVTKPIKARIDAKKAAIQVKKESQQKSEQLLIENLLTSFPVHLRPAVMELSKAIACLTPSELDNLVDSADWRTRKLIRMVAAAKLAV